MKKIIVLALAFLLAISPVVSTAKTSVKAENNVLRISNWVDYIYTDENGVNLAELFAEEYGVTVEYSTFGTNENLLNDLEINKKGDSYSFDLVCPSDYMIQKMISRKMLETIDINQMPNYKANVSPYIAQLFEENEWTNYAVPYLWGTMGYVYNPEAVNPDDIQNWSVLWNIDYKNTTTLKDSVRDTYFLGLAYVFRAELNELAKEYENALYIYENSSKDADATAELDAFIADYRTKLNSYLNNTEEETIAKVEKALKNVKENIFSFELDDGKNDMATGKVNINFAWSGDAVYSMDQAEEEANVELYYSVPKQGSNIWFDGWVMPKGANKELAYKFLDYISTSENAINNMEYIGYTSAMATQEIFDWVKESYGAEEDAEETYTVDLTYFFGDIVNDDTDNLNVAKIKTDTIGRQFSAQYPDKSVITRSIVMQNFDDETTDKINAMWERVKGQSLPIGLIIIIIIAIIAVVAAVAIIFTLKKKRPFSPKGKKLEVVKVENK